MIYKLFYLIHNNLVYSRNIRNGIIQRVRGLSLTIKICSGSIYIFKLLAHNGHNGPVHDKVM